MKQEFDEYKKKTATFNLEMQEKFESLTVKFENSLKTIASQNDRIEKLETNLTSTLENSRKAIHFHYDAIFSGNYQSSGGIIKFNSEISSSSDNGYDPKTGLFTTPCDGVFVFIVQFHAVSNADVGIYIDNIIKTKSSMKISQSHGTVSLVSQLTKGQVVEARLIIGKIWVNTHHTSFQGFKI